MDVRSNSILRHAPTSTVFGAAITSTCRWFGRYVDGNAKVAYFKDPDGQLLEYWARASVDAPIGVAGRPRKSLGHSVSARPR